MKANGNMLAIILVYVSDLIIIDDGKNEIQRTKGNLFVRFQIKEIWRVETLS